MESLHQIEELSSQIAPYLSSESRDHEEEMIMAQRAELASVNRSLHDEIERLNTEVDEASL